MSMDREKLEVTVRAGTTLSELNALLEENGLAMRILGSISDQTVGGAISTGKYYACSSQFQLYISYKKCMTLCTVNMLWGHLI